MFKIVRRSSVVGAVIVASMIMIEGRFSDPVVFIMGFVLTAPLMAIAASPFVLPFSVSKKIKSDGVLALLLLINLMMIGGYIFVFYESFVVQGELEPIIYLGTPIIYFVVFGPLIALLKFVDSRKARHSPLDETEAMEEESEDNKGADQNKPSGRKLRASLTKGEKGFGRRGLK
jgi:hypothetical protein